jgi:hypothetical protein
MKPDSTVKIKFSNRPSTSQVVKQHIVNAGRANTRANELGTVYVLLRILKNH